MIVAVPTETLAGEQRVALIPPDLRGLVEAGISVQVQSGAGVASGVLDSAYEEAGAQLVSDAGALLGAADLLVKVQPPALNEVARLREGSALIAALAPFANLEILRALAERNITAFALELMPRITRAQSMDILSSMSTIAGYKAILIAATELPKFFPLLMTAAGTIRPARVLVLGAGVAGLQAIATARRLGAVVEAFDIRAAVKEQVESLGARFVEQDASEDMEGAGGYAKEQTAEQLAAQREMLARHMADSDAVICTALVPGRRAPTLMTEEQVKGMRPGSVIIDLAAEQGGNCEVTEAGKVVDLGGVKVHGLVNVASSMPVHASQMFSRNVATYLAHMIQDGTLNLDPEDELVGGPLVTHAGKITNEAIAAAAEE